MLLLFTKAPAASVGPSRPSVPADNKEYSIEGINLLMFLIKWIANS